MMVFDGDSVMYPYRVKAETSWPYMVSEGDLLNLAKPKAVGRTCIMNVREVTDLRPELYVLQVGQWASNHEDERMFNKCVNRILGKLREERITSVVVTPPYSVWDVDWVCRSLCLCAQTHGAYYFDLYSHMSQMDESEWLNWLMLDEDALCHLTPYGHYEMAKLFKERVLQ